MGAAFQFTGPACCCCNHVYTADITQGDARRHSVSGGTLKIFPDPDGYGYDKIAQRSFLDFDAVHKKIFAAVSTDGSPANRVSKLDDDFSNEVTLDSVVDGSQRVSNPTSDPDGERVFFIVRDVPSTAARYLHVVNHDGTGAAGPLATLQNDSTGQVSHDMQYCRANSKIYYCGFDGTDSKLYRIDDNGANNTLIASPSQTNGDILWVDVDNEGEKVWWIEFGGATIGNSMMIWKADLDGSNSEVVVTLPAYDGDPALTIRGLQWSHKNQRVYWWQQDNLLSYLSDPTNGWFSAAIDGTDIQLECSRDQEWRFSSCDTWRLGCGWETTGASSPA